MQSWRLLSSKYVVNNLETLMVYFQPEDQQTWDTEEPMFQFQAKGKQNKTPMAQL